MNKFKLILFIIFGFIIVLGVALFAIGSFKPKVAGIYVETNPASSVFIDGKQVGRTPFRNTVKPGEVVIRLIPDSFEIPLIPYEVKVNMLAGVETVIHYDFANVEENASGDLISFEKNLNNETSLIAVSNPDPAEVLIDRVEKVFTPYVVSTITPGEHELKFSADSFKDRTINVKLHEGYKLTAIVKLAKSQEQTVIKESTEEAKTNDKVTDKVEILSTPTGYLRVRKEASTLGDEVGRVEPGKKYNLVSIDDKTGWYEIEFEKGKNGWISNQYAKKITESLLSPTPTLLLTPTRTK
jgi:hypothetical protein